MKKAFAVVGIILIVVFCVMEIQREEITRLQKEITLLKKDVHLFRALIIEDLTCLTANGRIGHNGYGEKCCDIDKRDINLFD